MSLMNVSPECPEEYMGNTLDPKYRRPKTNADHYRSMADVELAYALSEPFCDRRTTQECKSFHGDCPACVLDWLKQPYREEMDKNG